MQGSNGGSTVKRPAQELIAEGATSWEIVKNPRTLFFKFVGAAGIVLVVCYGVGFVLEVMFPGNGITRITNSVPSKVISGAASTVRGVTNDAGNGFQSVVGVDNDAVSVPLPEARTQQPPVTGDSSFSNSPVQ